MKKVRIVGVMLLLAMFVASCGNDLSINKCEELIHEHPFLKLRHVSFSPEKLPKECESVYAGTMKLGYSRILKDKKTAYYYYVYGFDIENVRNLLIEGTRAHCDFDLIEVNKTPAYKYIKDDRIDGQSMTCRATFVCFEDAGWQLDKIQCSERYFMINDWNGSSIERAYFK